jgi:hypothetical protein
VLQVIAWDKTKIKDISNPTFVPPDVQSCPQGYLPANTERRTLTLQRKREEYFGFIEQYYDSRNEEHHQDTYRQVQPSPAASCSVVMFLMCAFWQKLSGSSGCGVQLGIGSIPRAPSPLFIQQL